MHTYKISGKEVVVIREALTASNETLFKRIVELLITLDKDNTEKKSSNLEKK